MANRGFRVFRLNKPGDVYDPTSDLQFDPPKDSDELFMALKAAYPMMKTHKERMRDAVIDFLISERAMDASVPSSSNVSPQSFASPIISEGLSMSGSISPNMDLRQSPSFSGSPSESFVDARNSKRSPAASQSSSSEYCTPDAPLPFNQLTSVWNASGRPEPKKHTRKTMTAEEKEEYRRRRVLGACEDCKRKRRKCQHDPLKPNGGKVQDKRKTSKRSSRSRQAVAPESAGTSSGPPEASLSNESLWDPLAFDLPDFTGITDATSASFPDISPDLDVDMALLEDTFLNLDDTTLPLVDSSWDLSFDMQFPMDFGTGAQPDGNWPVHQTQHYTPVSRRLPSQEMIDQTTHHTSNSAFGSKPYPSHSPCLPGGDIGGLPTRHSSSTHFAQSPVSQIAITSQEESETGGGLSNHPNRKPQRNTLQYSRWKDLGTAPGDVAGPSGLAEEATFRQPSPNRHKVFARSAFLGEQQLAQVESSSAGQISGASPGRMERLEYSSVGFNPGHKVRFTPQEGTLLARHEASPQPSSPKALLASRQSFSSYTHLDIMRASSSNAEERRTQTSHLLCDTSVPELIRPHRAATNSAGVEHAHDRADGLVLRLQQGRVVSTVKADLPQAYAQDNKQSDNQQLGSWLGSHLGSINGIARASRDNSSANSDDTISQVMPRTSGQYHVLVQSSGQSPDLVPATSGQSLDLAPTTSVQSSNLLVAQQPPILSFVQSVLFLVPILLLLLGKTAEVISRGNSYRRLGSKSILSLELWLSRQLSVCAGLSPKPASFSPAIPMNDSSLISSPRKDDTEHQLWRTIACLTQQNYAISCFQFHSKSTLESTSSNGAPSFWGFRSQLSRRLRKLASGFFEKQRNNGALSSSGFLSRAGKILG